MLLYHEGNKCDNRDGEGGNKGDKGEKEAELSVIFVTASSLEEAKSIASVLLEGGLVACVNMVPQVTSMYVWEGKLEMSSEVILMIKVRVLTV